MTPDQRDALEKWFSGHQEVYDKLFKYYKFVKEAQLKETETYNIKMAKQERMYEQFIRQSLQVP